MDNWIRVWVFFLPFQMSFLILVALFEFALFSKFLKWFVVTQKCTVDGASALTFVVRADRASFTDITHCRDCNGTLSPSKTLVPVVA